MLLIHHVVLITPHHARLISFAHHGEVRGAPEHHRFGESDTTNLHCKTSKRKAPATCHGATSISTLAIDHKIEHTYDLGEILLVNAVFICKLPNLITIKTFTSRYISNDITHLDPERNIMRRAVLYRSSWINLPECLLRHQMKGRYSRRQRRQTTCQEHLLMDAQWYARISA